MVDTSELPGPLYPSRIALEEAQDVRYWTRKWGIDAEELAEAVRAVGPGAAAVARHLGRSEYE